MDAFHGALDINFISYWQKAIEYFEDVSKVPYFTPIRPCRRDDFEGFEDIYDEVVVKESLLCPDDRSKLKIENNSIRHEGQKDFWST